MTNFTNIPRNRNGFSFGSDDSTSGDSVKTIKAISNVFKAVLLLLTVAWTATAMSGGAVTVEVSVNDGNGALDYQNQFTFSGGTLLALGSSGNGANAQLQLD